MSDYFGFRRDALLGVRTPSFAGNNPACRGTVL